MSVTKDGDTGRWMSQIRVTDWTGKTIHKKKRGFAAKKEALQWERDFISQSTGSLGMTFPTLEKCEHKNSFIHILLNKIFSILSDITYSFHSFMAQSTPFTNHFAM